MKVKTLANLLPLIMIMSAAVHKADIKLVPCLGDNNKMRCSHDSKCIPRVKVNANFLRKQISGNMLKFFQIHNCCRILILNFTLVVVRHLSMCYTRVQ